MIVFWTWESLKLLALSTHNSFVAGLVMSGFLDSVTISLLDECSDHDKALFVTIKFGELSKWEDLVLEKEFVVVTPVTVEVFRVAGLPFASHNVFLAHFGRKVSYPDSH